MDGLNEQTSPATPAPGDVRSGERILDLLHTLADPIRLRIVHLLNNPAPADHSGLSVGQLADVLKLPQSTVSRHLKILGEAGLVAPRRDGTSTFYRLTDAAAQGSAHQFLQLTLAQLRQDSQVQADSRRLAAILRKRPSAAENFFGKHAPQWDQLRVQWFGDTFHLEGMLSLLNPAWIVADIGTGTGAMLPLLAPHVQKVIAVDPSEAMLSGARVRVQNCGLTNVDVRSGAAEELPIDKASVDAALLTLVLTYTADPPAVLREIRRILKPGGIVLVIDLQPHDVELFREKLNHRHMGFSQEQLTAWLTAAGFVKPRWHPIVPQKGRSKESATPIPDLFALRAEVTP
jgi:ArsR family transcriptional regulator